MDSERVEMGSGDERALSNVDDGADSGELGRVVRRLGPAGPAAIVTAFLPVLGSLFLFGVLTEFGPWLRSHGTTGLVAYIFAFAGLTGFSLLSNNAPSVLGGWAFGFAAGYPAALCGCMVGAMIGYSIARGVSGHRVTDVIAEHPKWQAVCAYLVGRGFVRTVALIALVRLCMPFGFTNFVLGALRIAPLTFFSGTLLGLGPRAAIVVYVASKLAELDLKLTGHRWLLGVSVILTILVLALIGHLANQAIAKVTATQADSPATPPSAAS
jgi:uncharacterized membrane protein YdjX (TVP38/TMEM64 family)